LVWDDIQNNAGIFYRAVLKLADRFGRFRIICAARSTELEKIEEIPVTFWEDFRFFEEEKILLYNIIINFFSMEILSFDSGHNSTEWFIKLNPLNFALFS